jgi:hypothetical protein
MRAVQTLLFDVFVFRKSGVPITSTQNALGQCKLSKSGANLILLPYKGNKLTINGTSQSIPAAGITLAPPATTLTLYYIYAYMNAGVMTLEASTTAHVTDATTGVEIKSGDSMIQALIVVEHSLQTGQQPV